MSQVTLANARDIMDIGTMDDSFYSQLYGGGSVAYSHHLMGGDYYRISLSNLDPDSDYPINTGPGA
jgi:hypothetical protein